jgi:hypothetical protein
MTFYRMVSTTNPPTPILTVLNPTQTSTNAPQLQIITPPGYSYTISYSTNLSDWNTLTNFYSTYWNTQMSDPSGIGLPTRYYRATTP